MSSQRISLDPTATDLTGTVYVPIVQNGINKKAAPSLFGGNENLSQILTVGNDGGGLQIKNIGDPTDNQDAVTLAYFNAHSSPGGVTSFNSRIGAIIPLVGDYSSFYWSLSSGGTLTGPNTITGTTSNTLKFSFASLNTTQTDGAGIWLQNPTAATSGNQQISPSITWEGQGYAATPAASQTVKYIMDVLPVQGSANPNGTWRLRSSINGGAYTDQITFNNNTGILGVNAGINGINSTLTLQVGGSEKSRLTAAGDLLIGSSSDQAKLYIVQSAASGTVLPVFRSDPGAHTGMTASTEFISRDFQGATWTWLDGTTTTQRFNYFRGYTVNKTTTSATFTDIYNVYIDTNTAGSGVIFSNNWALGVAGNTKIFSGSSILTLNPSAGVISSSIGLSLGSSGSNSISITGGNVGGSAIVKAGTGGGSAQLIDDSNSAGFNASNGEAFMFNPTESIDMLSFTTITTQGLALTQNAQTGSVRSLLTSSPANHTGMTASTEFISRDFKGATQAWLDGTVATQRFNYFRAYTANKTTTSLVFGDIYNVYIEQTTLNTGVSATNGNWALGIAGNAKMTGSRILLTGLPTSASGLPTGALWNNSGVINIAP